jgi:pilus assembly protein Flp/PilA
MRVLVSRLLKDESGATALEYGLIAALVFLVMLSALTAFADNGTTMFNNALDAISAAIH